MTEKEFELVINRMRAEMDQVMQNTAMRLSGSDLAPSMALEFAKCGVGICAMALAQIFRADVDNDEVMSRLCMDIATYIKITARADDHKAPIGAFKFLERLHKRGLQ